MEGFKLQSKLGDGAYSVVHKVIRNADGKTYALKKVKLQNCFWLMLIYELR